MKEVNNEEHKRISEQSELCSDMVAEMKRFELLRRGTPDLPHFECGPFNHLGTSPYSVRAAIIPNSGGKIKPLRNFLYRRVVDKGMNFW